MKTVQDDVSRFGLRRIHLVSMNGRVDVVPPEGWKVVDYLEYEEAEIGIWHLWQFLKKECEDENG